MKEPITVEDYKEYEYFCSYNHEWYPLDRLLLKAYLISKRDFPDAPRLLLRRIEGEKKCD